MFLYVGISSLYNERMKSVFFGIFLASQISFGFVGRFTNAVVDFVTPDEKEYCEIQVPNIFREKCEKLIRTKKFRREFVSVCNKLREKFPDKNPLDCLNTIGNKDPEAATRAQAVFCEALVESKSYSWSLRCLEANLTEDFAHYCRRFIETKNKQFKSALACTEALSKQNHQTIDMNYFKSKCLKINYTDEQDVINCLHGAENSKNPGTTSIRLGFKNSHNKTEQDGQQ